MHCLLIDNYDSFTWCLADYLARVFGVAPTVIRNDACTWAQVHERLQFDCIVISPGPGSVTNVADFNMAKDAVLQSAIPVLGVCLGFQGIAYLHGCRIEPAPMPFHGRASAIHHRGTGLFAGIPSPFNGIRYHSLAVAEPLSSDIIATAHTDAGLVMGIEHRRWPQWGVQFHPESILTEHGLQLLGNFRDLARTRAPRRASVPHVVAPARTPARPESPLQVLVQELDAAPKAHAVFNALFADRENCFWLDSQRVIEGLAEFSFMGAVEADDVLSCQLAADPTLHSAQQMLAALEAELESANVAPAELPFEFRGGFVGYLGHEMQAAFGGERRFDSALPDMIWLRVRRFIAFEHIRGAAWLVAITDEAGLADAQRWLEMTMADIRLADVPRTQQTPVAGLTLSMDLDHQAYLAAVAECRRAIIAGESYEVCLTNRFSLSTELDPLALYGALRQGNPAPFGAFIRSGRHAVLSTSPERFLHVAGGRVQSKPIKGTAARSTLQTQDALSAAALARSVKERAENLMIVDLMRSDLAHVAEQGSVSVAALMDVESYQTVHQLVSTVEATLRPDCSLIDLLRATFPGGSVTGAPKLRTLQIIDRLERSPRGVYCGAIGYLGYGRRADLNVAIRTLTYDGATLRFGAGGAITYLSDAQAEFDEMLLKAEALLRPLWNHLGAGAFTRQVVGGNLVLGEGS